MMPIDNASGPCLFRDSIFLDELLGELETELVDKLTAAGDRIIFQPGANVFNRGESPRSIYIHRRGEASLIIDAENLDSALACPVVPRCIYGLIEVLSESNFEAGLTVESTSEFDVIDRKQFLDQIRLSPGICFGLAKIFSRRYKAAVQTIKDR
jgi:CRP-like cAMP-binding protein